MLNHTVIAISSKTVVNDAEIAEHSAVIKPDFDVAFHCRHLDQESCMENRDIVRADRAVFEDLAYQIRNSLMHSEE
jgi:hypothetical protein